MGQYTNLNREEIERRVGELIAQYAGHGIKLHLDADDIHDRRQDEIWYGGEIASFEYKNRYNVYIEAVGDVEAYLNNGNGECLASVKDCCNGGSFYNEMHLYIPDDGTLVRYLGIGEDGAGDVYLEIADGNWLEVQIYDNKDKVWLEVYETLENSEGVLDIGYEDVIELVDMYVDEYEQETGIFNQ